MPKAEILSAGEMNRNIAILAVVILGRSGTWTAGCCWHGHCTGTAGDRDHTCATVTCGAHSALWHAAVGSTPPVRSAHPRALETARYGYFNGQLLGTLTL